MRIARCLFYTAKIPASAISQNWTKKTCWSSYSKPKTPTMSRRSRKTTCWCFYDKESTKYHVSRLQILTSSRDCLLIFNLSYRPFYLPKGSLSQEPLKYTGQDSDICHTGNRNPDRCSNPNSRRLSFSSSRKMARNDPLFCVPAKKLAWRCTSPFSHIAAELEGRA